MDFEPLLKQLQDWTNQVPLIILGSGSSAPYNLPTMSTLGDHLRNSISFVDPDDQNQFDDFTNLLDQLKDLEEALNQFQIRPNVLNDIIFKTWELVNKCDLEAYDLFVTEKNDFPLADLIRYLISTAGKQLSIITTNYDRLAEYAASQANAFICNGFSPTYMGCFTNQIHKSDFRALKGFSGHVNIWKVHGSLDWFKTTHEENIQLPLRHTIPMNLKPSIVTPGLSKYPETHLEPYRTILTESDSEIEKANGYLCIGYGFNDTHVQQRLENQIKTNKPIIVISKEITPKTKQAIIKNKSKAYILIEDANGTDTRIFSSQSPEGEIISNVSYWTLAEYLKLIK